MTGQLRGKVMERNSHKEAQKTQTSLHATLDGLATKMR